MKKVVFTFGRMNPPTIGHEKLANKIKDVAKKEQAPARIYLSHTQNNKTDPLSYIEKIRYAQKAFGIAHKSTAKNIFGILPDLEKEGYTDVIMVVGSDRVTEFKNLMNRYNGKEYNFNSISVVSAGERDPDAVGVAGMSGTKLRELAVKGEEKKFKSGLASKLTDADKTKIYNTIRRTIKEDVDLFDIFLEKTEVSQDSDIKDKEGTQPSVYYKGLSKSTKDKRDTHFKKGAKMDDDNPAAYKPAPGDATAKTKPSKHTKKYKAMFGESYEDTSELNEKIEGLVKKAEKSGMPYGILKKVYDRGMAAWRTGHRPGTTPQQWGFARVNSFVTKSSGTWGKADSDLAAKVRKEEFAESVWAESYLQDLELDELIDILSDEEITENDIVEFSELTDIDEAFLNVSQRLKRSRLMKRLAPKIARARKIRKKRMADAGRLLKRSRKQAKNLLRKKFAGKTGENYANLSYSQKMTVDKLVSKHSAKIEKLAKRLLPKIRKAEIARVQAARSSKNESTIVESAIQMENKPKRFKELFTEARKSSEESENILMGLRKAVSLKGKDIQFDNSKKMKVSDSEARKALAVFDDLRTTGEKQVYLKKLSKSPESFKAALTDKTPGKGEPKRGISLGGKFGKKFDEGAVDTAKASIEREKTQDKEKFDRILDRARLADVRTKNRQESVSENFSLADSADAAIIKKAEKSGIPLGVLREVYDRGIECYDESVHVGKTKQQFAFDRLNSFISGGKTTTTLDADLYESIYKSPAHARLQKHLDKIYKTSKYKNDVRKLGGTPEKPGSQNMFMKTKKEEVTEVGGAGERGTNALTKKYKSDTPGQGDNSGLNELGSPLERLLSRLRAKPNMNLAIRHYLKYKKENPTVDDRTAAVRVIQDMGLPLKIGTELLLKTLKDLNKLQTEEATPCCDDCDNYYDHEITEAEYQGKKVELNNPFRLPSGSTKKFGVYTKNDKGNIVKVTFGDPNMEIKRDDPARRKSFRARHGCDDNPGPKWKAKYWSCYQWRSGAKVDN